MPQQNNCMHMYIVYVCECMKMYMYIYIYLPICLHVYVCIYIYVYVYVYVGNALCGPPALCGVGWVPLPFLSVGWLWGFGVLGLA